MFVILTVVLAFPGLLIRYTSLIAIWVGVKDPKLSVFEVGDTQPAEPKVQVNEGVELLV